MIIYICSLKAGLLKGGYVMKKFGLGKILACVAAVFGLVAVFMMFAPGATYKVLNGTDSYSGAQLAFGYTAKADAGILGTASTEVFKFSFMNFLTYLLALVGIVFVVLAFFGKLGKISPVVAAVCFLVAGIFFFCVIPFCSPAAKNADVVKATKDALSLGAGAIVGGVFSIIAALASCATLFVNKK